MSLNRDKQFAPLLPKEEVEKQKLYSEPLSKPKPGNDKLRDRRMIRRLWAGIGVLALIVVALVSIQLYTVIPRPGEEMQMELYCVKVDFNGRIIEKGKGAFIGQFIHYGGSKSDEFLIKEGNILDRSWKNFSNEVWTDPDGRLLLGDCVEIGPNRDWVVVTHNTRPGLSGYYYICSTQENFDPAEIAQKSGYIPDDVASKIKP